MPATYDSIATTTLGSNTATITFTSIPSTYTDLRLVVRGSFADASYPQVRFNNAFSTYSSTSLVGSGSAASSELRPSTSDLSFVNGIPTTASTQHLLTMDIFSYAGSTQKTTLGTASLDANGSGYVGIAVGLWNGTTAINRIDIAQFSGANILAGTTATLYGILRA
jgi:hypothetical protein